MRVVLDTNILISALISPKSVAHGFFLVTGRHIVNGFIDFANCYREADMLSLICSGYVGTHRAETKALATIISQVAKGDKALVLAWQRKVQERGGNE